MRKSSSKTALVFLLIFSLTFSQIVPSLASANKNKLQVAFVGFKFENLPPDIQDILTWRMTAILEMQESFILTKPETVQKIYGREKITELLETQDLESFLAFAEQYEFDHVFSGILVNQSPDNNHIFLVGELNRFDLFNGHKNTYKINKSYEKFGNELVKFKEQYVKTLSITEDSEITPLSILLVGGIVVAGVLAIRFGFGNAGGEEETEPPPTDE